MIFSFIIYIFIINFILLQNRFYKFLIKKIKFIIIIIIIIFIAAIILYL